MLLLFSPQEKPDDTCTWYTVLITNEKCVLVDLDDDSQTYSAAYREEHVAHASLARYVHARLVATRGSSISYVTPNV